jgi:hypothetical protein
MSGISKVLIHKFESSSGKTEFHYQWIGPIDGYLFVPFESLDSDAFHEMPFKLMRMKNLPYGRIAVFVRIDWQARIMRFFRSLWRMIHE